MTDPKLLKYNFNQSVPMGGQSAQQQPKTDPKLLKYNFNQSVPMGGQSVQQQPKTDPKLLKYDFNPLSSPISTPPISENSQTPIPTITQNQNSQNTSLSSPTTTLPTQGPLKSPEITNIVSDLEYVSGNLSISQDHPNFTELNKRKNQFSVVNGLPPTDIAGMIKSGSMFPGSSLASDLQKMNPELYNQAQMISEQEKNLDSINSGNDTLYNSLNTKKQFSLAKNKTTQIETKPDPTIPINDYISSELKSRFGEFATDYYDVTNELMSAPNIQKWKDDVYKLSDQVNKYDQQIENLYEEAGRELGDEAPDYLRSAYVSTKAKEIRRLRDPLVKELGLAQNMLQVETSEQMKKLDMVTKGMQTDLSNKQLDYQNKFNEQKFTYSQQQNALSRQDKLNAKSTPTFSTISQNITPEIVDSRPARVSIISQLYANSGGGTDGFASSVNEIPDGSNGGQCGAFVNDMLRGIGDNTHFGDTYKQKMSLTNDSSVAPTVGSAVVFKLPGKYADNGHVGVITDMGNGTITVKESNFNGNEKVGTRKISMKDPSIGGFYTPTKLSGLTPTSPAPTSSNSASIPPTPTSKLPSLSSILSSSGKISSSGLKKLGLEGKNGPEVLDYISKNYLQDIKTDPKKLASQIASFPSMLGSLVDIGQGNKPLFSNSDDKVDLLGSLPEILEKADVDYDVGIKTFATILKKQIEKSDVSSNDLDGSKNIAINLKLLLDKYKFDESDEAKKTFIDLMKTVMTEKELNNYIDLPGLDPFKNAYETLYSQAFK